MERHTAHPYRLPCEQWNLTALRRDRLVVTGLVEIEYEAEAVGVLQGDNGVILTVQRPDGTRNEAPAR